MKTVNVIAFNNCAELHLEDGSIILFSYSTPVAGVINTGQIDMVPVRTEKFYSKTTNKHIDDFFGRNNIPQDNIVWTNEKELRDLIAGK